MAICYVPNRNADGLRPSVLMMGNGHADPIMLIVELRALCDAVAALAAESEDRSLTALGCLAGRMAGDLLALVDAELNPSQARAFRRVAQQIAAGKRT
jgi:hypothetical protein